MNTMYSSCPPSPHVETIDEARENINHLWRMLHAAVNLIQANGVMLQSQAQRIIDLEERLGLNSSNSSKPPSTDNPAQTTAKTKKKPTRRKRAKRGAQPGHKGTARELVPIDQVNHIVTCTPYSDCFCGGHVMLDRDQPERKQVFELPRIPADVTEYQIFSGICDKCGKRHAGVLPIGVPSGILGPCATAKIAIMTGEYRLSKRLVVRMMDDFHGLKICIGTVSNAEKKVSDVLAIPVKEAVSYVQELTNEAVNGDETGHKQAGVKMNLWVASALLVTVFMIRVTRSTKEAVDLLGIGFLGILISDRWGAYNWVDVTRRQLCWAHLIRDFVRIAIRGGRQGRIGLKILAYSRRMFKLWYGVRNKTLSRSDFQQGMVSIRAKIEALLEQGAQLTGDGESKTAGTCKKILKFRVALWTFVDHEGVEPTNNQAERMLRHYVLWRKSSFGTQSDRGNRFVERILTVVSTCHQQKRSVLGYVTDAVKANLGGRPVPSLLPQKKTEHANLAA